MKKITALLGVWLVCWGPAAAKEPAPAGGPVKIHMISGSKQYKSEASLTAFKAYLEKHFNVRCTLTRTKDGSKDLPNIDALDGADVLVVFCRRLKLPPEPLAKIKGWCKAGKPVVGVRTASHAFQTWLAFDREVLGGDYQGHGGGEKEIRVTVEAKDHPILAGVQDWVRPGMLYRNPGLAKDVTVLLRGAGKKDAQPLAWARTYDKTRDGRSFYTSMGLPGDFENETFRKLLVNAITWTAKRKIQPRTDTEKRGAR